jgi:hypothetical protein
VTDDAELPDPPISDMPPVLAAVLMRYDAASRRDAMRNWTVIGDDGQRDYDRYLARTLPGWTRRQRARKLARRLITGME